MYYVRMNIRYKGKIIEIQGFFEEARNTGMREALSRDLARRAGLCEITSFDGWCEDPYDPGYKKGVPMNLAERAALDGLFPDNPLSQAREFIQAVLFDELMEVVEEEPIYKEKNELDLDLSKEEKYKNEAEQKEKEREMLLPLFEKGEACRRHRYTVNVK